MENDTYLIYILRGVDESAVGLSIDGWEIKVIHENELPDDKPPISNLYNRLKFFLSNINDRIFNYTDVNENNPKYIYLIKQTRNPNDVKPIMDTLRLFMKSQIGTTYPIKISENGATIIQRAYDYHSYEFDDEIPKFSLTPQEKLDIEELYQKVKTFYSLQQQKPDDKTFKHINNMLDLFHEAYRVSNPEIAFILRVTILEMLMKDNAELSYKLSLFIAIFLGKNKKESTEIFNNCNTIYSARSDFLHNGNKTKIDSTLQEKALDYSRRMVANLINITLEIQEEDRNEQEKQHKQRQKRQKKPKDWILETIRKQLIPENFGENPFNVKF